MHKTVLSLIAAAVLSACEFKMALVDETASAAASASAPQAASASAPQTASAAVSAPTGSPQAAALPFVGTRHFNFESAACSEQSITIAPTGDTTVQFIGCDKTVTLYQGPYQTYLPTDWGDNGVDNGFYQIKDNIIYALDHKQQALMGCVGGHDQPCASTLSEK